MGELRATFAKIKENPRIFVKKLAFTVPSSILFAVTALLLMTGEVDGEPITKAQYFVLCILIYICFVLPTNIFIRLMQANEQKMSFLEYIFYEEEEKGISYYAKMPVVRAEEIFDNNEVLVDKASDSRQARVKKKRGMNAEELRCFALQCNDYVEKQEAACEEDIENRE